jgi:hypothetical protein
MGLNSSQGYIIRLIANDVQLDLFNDETIEVSNNVTGLFDIGLLPSEFTRQILIPGTKKNNEFFKHIYDISVDNPYLFATNVKIPAYFDFDGLYISQGYLQLNKVNIRSNKFIESYEIGIFGTISSFSRDINRLFLTELSSLSQYNHTASYQNITDSWDKNLLNGDIVYPLADYGTGIEFRPGDAISGIDSQGGALTVADFKPGIRVKKVLDAIFQQTNYTYSSSFFNESWWNDVYMIANNSLKYPEFPGFDLEVDGLAKWGAESGSGTTDVSITYNTITKFPWVNTLSDPTAVLGEGNSYYVWKPTALQGILNLELRVSSSLNEITQVELHYWDTGSTPGSTYIELDTFNEYFVDLKNSNTGGGGLNQKVTLQAKFNTSKLPIGYYNFGIKYTSSSGGIRLTLDPGGQPRSYIQITKLLQGADGEIMNIPFNMPFGQSGIKCVDFLRSLQRKFNLVIYPNKTKQNEFIIEPFNNWYDKGKIKNFDKYIDLSQNIEVIPANNLAVNRVEFGDKLGNDYIAQQFQKENIREFGKSYFIDSQNFFSQGEFKVETDFESSPLTLVLNSGVSGSVSSFNPSPPGGGGGVSYGWSVGNQGWFSNETACQNTSFFPTTLWTAEPTISGVTVFYNDYSRTDPYDGGFNYWKLISEFGFQFYSVLITSSGQQISIADCQSGAIF